MAGCEMEYLEGKAEFLRQAAEAYDRMMCSDQEQMITFDQMEDRALEVGAKLERFLMERRLSGAARETNAATACCPHCRRSRSVAPDPKPRRLRGRTGEVSFERREGFCAACRKAFFPSGPGLKTGR
jgi:hypothetical protein